MVRYHSSWFDLAVEFFLKSCAWRQEWRWAFQDDVSIVFLIKSESLKATYLYSWPASWQAVVAWHLPRNMASSITSSGIWYTFVAWSRWTAHDWLGQHLDQNNLIPQHMLNDYPNRFLKQSWYISKYTKRSKSIGDWKRNVTCSPPNENLRKQLQLSSFINYSLEVKNRLVFPLEKGWLSN